MPIKYRNTGNDIIKSTSLVENMQKTAKIDSVEDMMSEIIAKKTKMKASSMMNMIGVLTPVTYYQAVPDSTNNYNSDAEGPSDIAFDTKKYIKIKDFKIKLTNAASFDNERDEEDKSYVSSGSFIVLPRTIYPNIGDFFHMVYYGRTLWYMVSSVNTTSYENDSGFECEYTLYSPAENKKIGDHQIVSTKVFRQELIGTTYKSVLDDYELELLTKFKELYTHLSDVYNGLFYDKAIDAYICRNYDLDQNNNRFEDNNNINTLGVRGGVFRSEVELDSVYNSSTPRYIPSESAVYDNNLNTFISKHKIFRNFDGLLIAVEPKMGFDRVNYMRSVFGALEARSISNYKNKFVSPCKIEVLTQNINAYFVGKFNAIHDSKEYTSEFNEFFPKSLVEQLINGNKTDLNLSCTNKVYNSLETIILETIVRYAYESTADFKDRFLYLYDRIDGLYEHTISYANIYYLFPMLGFILDRTLDEMYSTNSSLTT